jgi:L-iditol 2-dehydrogenase
LEYAEKFGAYVMINAKKEDPVKLVRKLTKMGSDFVIEAAGTQATVEQTPFLVCKADKVALIGESKGHLNLDDADEAPFFAMYISPVEYPAAVELIGRKIINAKGLMTLRFKLKEFEKALETMDNPAEKALKVVIKR